MSQPQSLAGASTNFITPNRSQRRQPQKAFRPFQQHWHLSMAAGDSPLSVEIFIDYLIAFQKMQKAVRRYIKEGLRIESDNLFDHDPEWRVEIFAGSATFLTIRLLPCISSEMCLQFAGHTPVSYERTKPPTPPPAQVPGFPDFQLIINSINEGLMAPMSQMIRALASTHVDAARSIDMFERHWMASDPIRSSYG